MKTLAPFTCVSWLVLALPACGSGDDEPTHLSSEAVLELEPAPELAWRDCGTAGNRRVECAELQVPLDHADPEGEQILIALNRILAPENVERRGALLYNPGGPGGSGKAMARSLAGSGSLDGAAPGFDIVGFDPRGVGDSSALECEFIDAFMSGEAGDASPEAAMMEAVSAYGLEGVLEDLAWLSEQCRSYWGGLFDHMGSNQVVEDMEHIRLALGEGRLNFLGMSYGTRLGALYAQRYPEQVRAIVLDAPLPRESSMAKQVQGQFEELLVMHEAFFTDCEAGRLTCPPDARGVFDALLASADAAGIAGPMLSVWELGLSYGFGTFFLPFLLEQQVSQANSDWMYGPLTLLEDDTSSFIQNLSVNCADNATPSLTLDEITLRLDDAFARAPLFASELMPLITCSAWSVMPDPVAPLTAPDAPPLLVIGGTRDSRTPGAWAHDLSESLDSAVLLTSDHWGHTIVGGGSPCVDDAVQAYLVDLTLPAEGSVCPPPSL